LERGDKYDKSVMYLLSTLPGETFWVEKKGGGWKVTIGEIVVDAPAVAEAGVSDREYQRQKVVATAKIKPKPKTMKFSGKPKTKKVKR
jgi:predicted NUDIX family NTP pyrophosphohydrolase